MGRLFGQIPFGGATQSVQEETTMARDGFLILDSDLHMMEPDDLWARYLEGPHRSSPPRFFGGQREQLKKAQDDKGNADSIMGMEVQGLAIPAHNMQQGATVSSRE